MNALRLQQNLSKAGYDPGTLDGALGPKTYAALVNYAAGRVVGERSVLIGRAMAADFPRYQINTPERISHFVGQCCHESGGFRYMQELGGADYFAKYDGRADLGNIYPGDGSRFHGRGIIQITGRSNYVRMGTRLGIDLISNPDRAAEPEIAVLIACLYWADHGLNAYADENDAPAVSRAINRGNPRTDKPANHEAERIAITNRLLEAWT